MFSDREGNPSLDYLQMQAKNDVARRVDAGIPLSRLWLDAHTAAGSGKLSRHEATYFQAARREIASRSTRKAHETLLTTSPGKMSAKIAGQMMTPLQKRSTTPASPTMPVMPRESGLETPGKRDAATASIASALPPTPPTDPRMTEFHRRCQRQSVRAGSAGQNGE
jgi:hypothetical protein